MTNSNDLWLSFEQSTTLNSALEAELTRRRNNDRLRTYSPYEKQARFHNFGATCKQRLLRAGNQQGKTHAGAMEMAMHLTGRYPQWWQGRRFTHAIDAWAACDTSETTRDNPQRALMGPHGEWGTGTIPLESLIEAKRGQAAADALDIVLVRHSSGGVSKLGFKRYDQGREAWQGPARHVIWCDEEPPESIYSEALARLIATNGMVYTTFTPLKGLTRVVSRLMRAHDGINCADVNMGLADALHIAPGQRQQIIDTFPEHEREARIEGVPVLGSGRVFPVEAAQVKCRAFAIPPDWPLLGGMDFGWEHPFAAIRLAWDCDGDCVYVTHAYRVRHQTPVIHAGALRAWGRGLVWAWPHDGLATEKGSGVQLMKQYEGQLLNLLPAHATHIEGGNRVEPGIFDMLDRMKTGRLKVFDHLDDWFREFETYHRDNGQIVKLDDDLISATRIAIMMLRHAKPHGWQYDPVDGSSDAEHPAYLGPTI